MTRPCISICKCNMARVHGCRAYSIAGALFMLRWYNGTVYRLQLSIRGGVAGDTGGFLGGPLWTSEHRR